jgi:SAM-dependent methyltransferase
MNIAVFIVFLFLASLLASAMVLFLLFAFDSLALGHDLPTSKRAIRALVKIIQQRRLDARNFYDIGCAHGGLALAVKKALPYLEVYGIDTSAARIFFSRLKAKILRRSVHFCKLDIFNANLSSADILYAYLWYDVMPLLEKKLQNELQKGALVITSTSHFSSWKPLCEVVTYPGVSKMPDFETLFVYVKQ